MHPCRLVCRPENGTRNVASLPRLCQMPHAWAFVWPFCLYSLSDVPRGQATWPVCIVSRQQNLDKVEQDVGQQVEKEQRGPPPGSRSHPACATCMTYGRWYEPNHRYLNIPFTCTWVLYDYFSSYSYSLFLLTAKFFACLYLYSEQVIRVVRATTRLGNDYIPLLKRSMKIMVLLIRINWTNNTPKYYMPSPFRSEILSDKFYIFSVLLSLYDICSINGQTSCIPVSQVTKHSRTYVDHVCLYVYANTLDNRTVPRVLFVNWFSF